jgi:hypothetical protein
MKVTLTLCFLLAIPLFGSGKKWTDAENLGFAGPVKSVSTSCRTFMQQPTTPQGPTILYEPLCEQCEFDRHGNQVRSRPMRKGQSSGSVDARIAEGREQKQEEIWKNEKGEVVVRHVYTTEASGNVQDDSYVNGKLVNSTFRTYDGRGNVIESSVYVPNGRAESHAWSKFDVCGNELESVSEGPGHSYYDVVRTYNAQTGRMETFKSLNRDGSMRFGFTVKNEKRLPYAPQAREVRTLGTDIVFDGDIALEWNCRESGRDGTYTAAHYVFTDKTKRDPVKAIIYGTDHQIVIEADYGYELDGFGNWTKRTVWVQTGESGERRLFEKDVRTLTYYPAGGPLPLQQ